MFDIEKWRAERQEKIARRKKRWKAYSQQNKEQILAGGKVYAQKIKLVVLTHYSNGTPQCTCCGEDDLDVLCIDHIKGGGNLHRKEVGFGVKFYLWLRRNNYPKEFQVLCRNCNWKKRIKGGLE